jgi:hypothetical protein
MPCSRSVGVCVRPRLALARADPERAGLAARDVRQDRARCADEHVDMPTQHCGRRGIARVEDDGLQRLRIGGIPGIACRYFCTTRAPRSAEPPAPAELAISTFFCGFQVCAPAVCAATIAATTIMQRMVNRVSRAVLSGIISSTFT